MEFNMNDYKNYFFVGLAGTGMSAIAQYLKGSGKKAAGSDRIFNEDKHILIREQFKNMGIYCFAQDGSGIDRETDVVVISSAIEESNIEYQKAISLKIPVIKRSELLAAISNEKRTIAVGGTAGKSTTTAMIFHILQEAGLSPSLITGAGLADLQEKGLPGNAWIGTSDWLVIEADESDGSIVSYFPEIGIVLNISRDHKEFIELIDLFITFRKHTKSAFIVNRDNAMAKKLSTNPEKDFAIVNNSGFHGSDFQQNGFSIRFTINNIQFQIPGIGQHNMENALAAVAASSAAGVSVEDAATALRSFRGIYRRTQLVGEKNGISVIDDFAHNPAEIAAAIKACQSAGKRVLAWFQPHGYGPLRFMHEELAEKTARTLRPEDHFYMSEVYYAGGTVNKDINSDVVINALQGKGKNAFLVPDKDNLPEFLKQIASRGDIILLMGARDPNLGKFARKLFDML